MIKKLIMDIKGYITCTTSIIATGYVIGSSLWIILSLIFTDTWWLFFLNAISAYLLLPNFLFLVYFFFSGRKILTIMASIQVIIFLILFGKYLLPRFPRQFDGTSISVMTYNVLWTNTKHHEKLISGINSSGADVVALQELNRSTAQSIAHQLIEKYPFQVLKPADDDSGMGIISRYPLQILTEELPGEWIGQPQIVKVSVENVNIVIVNIHNISVNLDSLAIIKKGIVIRERNSRNLIDFVQKLEYPIIVMGDFNMTDQNQAYKILSHNLRDAWRDRGFGLGHTFPGGPDKTKIFGFTLPSWLFRLDYIFYNHSLKTQSIQLGPWDGFSDHRPIIATLSVEPSLIPKDRRN